MQLLENQQPLGGIRNSASSHHPFIDCCFFFFSITAHPQVFFLTWTPPRAPSASLLKNCWLSVTDDPRFTAVDLEFSLPFRMITSRYSYKDKSFPRTTSVSLVFYLRALKGEDAVMRARGIKTNEIPRVLSVLSSISGAASKRVVLC